jgi:hypothetical protein
MREDVAHRVGVASCDEGLETVLSGSMAHPGADIEQALPFYLCRRHVNPDTYRTAPAEGAVRNSSVVPIQEKASAIALTLSLLPYLLGPGVPGMQ